VLLRGDAYVGSIERMRDWDDYLLALQRLLDSEPTHPPSVGIPVHTIGQATRGCH
jgi:hypothetical protein